MKKPSLDLFELIKKLTVQEVKHFRQYLRLQESNTQVLFEYLVKAVEYDESKIRKSILPGLNSNQFSVAKHYLYNTLLMYLMQRDQQQHSVWKIRTRLQMLEVLFRKELFQQCKKLMKSIERAARQLDDPSLLKDVYLWQLKLADRLNHAVSEEEFMAIGDAFTENAKQDLELSNQLWHYHEFFFLLRKNGVLRTVEAIGAEYQALFEGATDPMESTDTSFAGRLTMQHAHSTFMFMKGAADEAYQGHLWISGAMEDNPGWIALRPDIYLDAVFRLGVLAVGDCRFEEGATILQKIKKLKNKHGIQEGRLFFYQTQLERLIILLTKKWTELKPMVRRFEDDFERISPVMSRAELMTFYFNNSVALFNFGDLRGAKRRLNELLNMPEVRENPDFLMISKLLLLLIAEQERDADSFKYWHRVLYRLLNKRKGTFDFEQVLVSNLPKVFKSKTQAKRDQSWKNLHACLVEASKQGSGRAIHYFDFLSWVKAKASGQNFEEIFGEKITKYMESKKGSSAES